VVDQRPDRVERRGSFTRAHVLGGGQPEPPGEDGQPAEEGLLGGGEKVVAPGDPGAHGPQPLRHVLRAIGEQGEAATEPDQQRLRGQQGHPGRRQFDRQRQAVQAPADPGDRGGVFVGEGERRAHRRGPLDEQTDGLVLDQRARRRRSGGLRKGQRRYGEDVLAGDPQQRPARHQQRDAWTTDHQVDQDRPGREDVLEVVQDQQQPARAENAYQCGGRGPAGGLGDAEHLGDPRRNPVVVADGRELHERDLVEPGVEIRRDLHREPGLAHTAGSGERDQPDRRIQHERAEARCLPLPPDQPGEIRRWTADPRRPLPAGRDRSGRVSPATLGTTSIGHRLDHLRDKKLAGC
jgi:hypothetical protein